MKFRILIIFGLIFLSHASFAQNYISGVVGLYGTNAAGGATTVGSGASFFFNSSTFYEQGNFINLGDSTAISADTATLAFNGTIAQSASGRFKLGGLRLLNQAGLTLTNAVSPSMITILDSVSFGAISNTTLTAGDSLMTLRSTAFKTARIADLTGGDIYTGNNIIGKVEVERFIQGKRAWRLLCPPTTGDSASGQTIKDAWQEGATAPRGQVVNPHPGYGTVISRPGSNPASATGYDDGIAGAANYSLRMFTKDGVYTQPVNTDNVRFSPHAAYIIEIRGDRSVQPELQTPTYATLPTITNLRSKGQLNNGQIVSTVTKTGGSFAGVGNPYASTIDFSKVVLNGVTNGFYVWDPTIGTLGAWIYIDGTANYAATPVTPPGVGTYTDPATNTFIQSGQAVLVKTTGTTGTLTFKESNKNATSRISAFRQQNIPALNISLYRVDTSNTLFMDGTSAAFDPSFSKKVLPDEDISKPGNITESLSFLRDNNYLIKERLPNPLPGDSLYLPVWRTTEKKYRLMIDGKNMPSSPQPYLVDQFKHTSTPILTSSVMNYDFDVTSDAASKDLKRFTIVFQSNVLPVRFTSIKATVLNGDINVEWNVSNENNIASYDVEKSTDGRTFSKIGSVAAKQSAASIVYHLLDTKANPGSNYYRVKSIGLNGEGEYTGIAEASLPNVPMLIVVSPNPVKSRTIQIRMTNAPAEKYSFILFTSDGRKVLQKSADHPGGTATYTMAGGALAQGIYMLRVLGDKDEKVKKELRVIIE